MEILFKIIITIVTIAISFLFLRWIWKSQIDLKATSYRIIKKFTPGTDVIATRSPDKIYQNGQEVGEVTAYVKIEDDSIIFEELCETEKLDQSIPFEYQRHKLRIVSVEATTGMKIVAYQKGSKTKKSVLSNVTCKKVQ